jgi:hypothetical protein
MLAFPLLSPAAKRGDSAADAASSTKKAKTLPLKVAAQQSRRSAAGKRTWGIEVVGVHLVSAGYMLEFQYHVLDAAKAKTFADRRNKPYLVDRKTGAKVMVPSPQKIGSLRNSGNLEAGRNYWIMFANPGRMIKAGNKVNVVVGEFQAEGIVVE